MLDWIKAARLRTFTAFYERNYYGFFHCKMETPRTRKNLGLDYFFALALLVTLSIKFCQILPMIMEMV